MEFNGLSDELKEKLMAAETLEELAALAEENGFELADEELDGVAGGVKRRPIKIQIASCLSKLIYVACDDYED